MKNCLKLVSTLMLISSIFLGCKGEIQYVDRIVEVEKTYAASVIFEATGAEGVVNVTMASTTEGAKIYYTTDGTEPSAESTFYTDVVAISEDTTFKAIAVKEGMENSPVSFAKYSVVNKIETKIETKIEEKEVEKIVYTDKTYAVPVTFAAQDEEYGVSLTLSTETQGAVIYYTTDSSTPTAESTPYTQSLRIEANTTVKAIAIKEGIENSPVSVATVTIKKITQTAVGAGNPLQITLSAAVPHENGYSGNKSNTKVTVTANITTASNVKKVVWKKDGSLIAKTLLADTNASAAIETSDNAVWTFDISASDETANGNYTVAAIDEAGREEAEQIEINNFDFTPPALVSNLTAVYSSEQNNVILNWTKPLTADFDHVEITYTYNDGSSESAESQAVIVSSTDKTFAVKQNNESAAKIYKYYVKSVDILGNTSSAATEKAYVLSGIKASYKFHENIEYLEAGTNGSAGTSATYVYFGDWPQTVKADSVLVYENLNMTIGGFTYYTGSDDNWYVKCIEDAYKSDYTYSDGSTVAQLSSNSEKYFKVEPIKWRVLNPNATGAEKKILLAENILTAKIAYYDSLDSRKLNENDAWIYTNNYMYSNIRAFLNGLENQFITDGGASDSYNIDWSGKGFLNSAFTTSAIQRIADTEVDNTASSTYPQNYAGNNTYACDNTTDKIFLLSEQEVTSSAFGFAAYDSSGVRNKRIRVTTDYAKANSAFQHSTAGFGGTWWLRSPYNKYSNHARVAGSKGDADTSEQVQKSYNTGVVPALCLND